VEHNFSKISEYVVQCAKHGAKLICLPENFAFMGSTPEETDQMKETLDGPLIKRYAQMAIDNKVWLSLGGFQEKIETQPKRYSKQ